MESLFDRLHRLAGVKPQITVQSDEFTELCNALNSIHQAKGKLYGSAYLHFPKEDVKPSVLIGYADIHRKYTRLHNMIWSGEAEDQIPTDALLETCSDLAVYCLMLIQIIARVEQHVDNT